MNVQSAPPSGPSRSYTCPWCGHTGTGAELSCPSCGASVDVQQVKSHSGWSELPGRRDMAKLQFGHSTCQIEGTYVPVAEMNLAAGDWVYFNHHVLLWMDTVVKVSAMSLAGGWKRMLAGMPLIMTQAMGPGHIAFSRDLPGETIALPLQVGQTVDVREHLFMVATGSVGYTWFNSDIWIRTQNGNETETHYPIGMFLDRFGAAQQPGLLLLHAGGNVFVRQLAEGESILVKPTALLFKDSSVHMHLHMEQPAGNLMTWRSSSAYQQIWLRLRGPGRVAIQSHAPHLEGAHNYVSSSSRATTHRW
jgi:uncharacterized protein (AIM24 family)